MEEGKSGRPQERTFTGSPATFRAHGNNHRLGCVGAITRKRLGRFIVVQCHARSVGRDPLEGVDQRLGMGYSRQTGAKRLCRTIYDAFLPFA